MAGIFERMAVIVKANVNELLDKFEDPEKLVDQTIADAKVEYDRVKKDALPVFANETAAKKKVEETKAQAEKWHGIAVSALKAGNEDDAKKALAKEETLKASVSAQQAILETAAASAEKLREKLREMEEEIRDMEAKAAEIKAKAVTAKAIGTAERLSGKGIDRGAFDAFARMEEKAEKQLAEAEALESFNQSSAVNEEKELEKKYSGGAGNVDDALANLKKELGME